MTQSTATIPVTPELIDHIANLSRLALSDDEKAKMLDELPRILGMVAQLSELDTSSITSDVGWVSGLPADASMPLRPDTEGQFGKRSILDSNPPKPEDGYFAVPQILEV
ncbi:MAG: Asp-tRNA(Asn)/Glu-tRNA(Gln) amidotransferase subunit GatC [Vampirovibrionales bacterium]|nr:Asp-tRNA(Asn)/Glu-tRNA(Gln) amidotransferase subunit GatC [Vampirovibrionales bacterium]